MAMRWEDEKYVRFYTRDTTDWLNLSWQAQGLMGLIMRKCDRAGILGMTREGARLIEEQALEKLRSLGVNLDEFLDAGEDETP